VSAANLGKKVFAVKKKTALILGAGAVLSLTAVALQKKRAKPAPLRLANPFVEHDSLESAALTAGFPLTVPEAPEGYGERLIQVMGESMIQVIFRSGEDRLIIRKATGDGDISGDYNEYDESWTVTVGGAAVKLRGSGGMVSVATWERDGFAYAVDLDRPMAEDALTALIRQIS